MLSLVHHATQRYWGQKGEGAKYAQCDKLDGQAWQLNTCKYCQMSDWQHFSILHSASTLVELSWQHVASYILRGNSESPEFETKFQKEVPVPWFWSYLNFLVTLYRIGKGSFHTKNQLRPFSCFETIPACNRWTDTETGRYIIPCWKIKGNTRKNLLTITINLSNYTHKHNRLIDFGLGQHG